MLKPVQHDGCAQHDTPSGWNCVFEIVSEAEFLKLDSEKALFENKRTEYEPKFQEAITGFSEKKIENEADIQKRISETIHSAISENAKKLTEEQKLFAEKISETHQQSEREHEELLLAQTKKEFRKQTQSWKAAVMLRRQPKHLLRFWRDQIRVVCK